MKKPSLREVTLGAPGKLDDVAVARRLIAGLP